MILLAAPCGNVAGGVSATRDRGTVVDPDGADYPGGGPLTAGRAVAMLTGPRHPGRAPQPGAPLIRVRLRTFARAVPLTAQVPGLPRTPTCRN